MPKVRGVFNRFNRGEVDPHALAREDVKKVVNSCALMTNFLPMRLGPMQYRPGTEYTGTCAGLTGPFRMAPFLGSGGKTDIKIVTDASASSFLFPSIAGAGITQVVNATTTLTNPSFTSNLTGWTDASGSGSSTAWMTGGYAKLTGAGSTKAVLYQTSTSTDTGTEHRLEIGIARAPVTLQIGTSGAGSSDIFSGTLDPGVFMLFFTPSTDFTITLSNPKKYSALVDYATLQSAKNLYFEANLGAGNNDQLRWAQSADVMYFAHQGDYSSADYHYPGPFKFERYGEKSCGISEYRADDGPFELINNTDMTMTPGALSGDTTLTASDDFFQTGHVGALFKVVSSGQQVTAAVSAADNGTNSIRVTGVGDSRHFTVTVSGTFTATVTLQRSADDATWEDVKTYTTATTEVYDDSLDNSILYYRLWVKTGDYTSGTANLDLTYAAGSIEGICRVIGYTSSTVVDVQVLQEFGGTSATRDWYEGSWSGVKGYPTAVELYEGRLWWAGRNKVWGSVSDSYYSFDRSIEGDSSSIQKTIGFGPVEDVRWLAASNRLLMGIKSDEISIRSNSFGSVLSPSNCNLKAGSNQGVADVIPVRVDDVIYYIQRSGIRLYGLEYDINKDGHAAYDLTTMNPTILGEGVKRIVAVRQPETRIYALTDQGNLMVYTIDRAEDVAAWSRIDVGATIDEICALPGDTEDYLYITVTRNSIVRIERFAPTTEAVGGTVSKHLDSFVQYSSPGTTITGLSHLNGETVGVWADGQDRGTYVVSGGQITVGSSWTDVIVGLPHTASYTSNKLSGFISTSVMSLRKRVVNLAFLLRNYWPDAITYSDDGVTYHPMPDIEDGKTLDTTTTVSDYDAIPIEFDGESETDPRIYLKATGPCTILAMTYDIDGADDPADQ